MGELTGRRQEFTLPPVCDDGGGWNSVRWSECGGGVAERWTSVERHSKEPQVAHCSPAAAPASPPPSSSLPGNRTPLKASAWAIQREARGVGCMCVCVYTCIGVCVCVCVCYITKKVFYCPHTQKSARYHAKSHSKYTHIIPYSLILDRSLQKQRFISTQ